MTSTHILKCFLLAHQKQFLLVPPSTKMSDKIEKHSCPFKLRGVFHFPFNFLTAVWWLQLKALARASNISLEILGFTGYICMTLWKHDISHYTVCSFKPGKTKHHLNQEKVLSEIFSWTAHVPLHWVPCTAGPPPACRMQELQWLCHSARASASPQPQLGTTPPNYGRFHQAEGQGLGPSWDFPQHCHR